ncbi:pyridoxal phosphate-dependent decarboxylase family protein [Melissococcus plutonius]|uniref:pyridoxal phosphate-dependent decarboxylase family protein n=1 Tax=Melissococcus plutonius TaxID=33970 RepID=UPI003EE56F6A
MAETEFLENTEFLTATEDNFNCLLDKLKILQAENKKSMAPKLPIKNFNYLEELAEFKYSYTGKDSEETLKIVGELFQGAIRPHSPYSLFNMVPTPLLDAVAASMMTQVYNVNSLMDDFGGQSLLIEQKVARGIGSLIGWHHSVGISCNGGKLTLFYAIKLALAKMKPDSNKKGLSSDLVILTNESSHYCVEHVCSLLGLGSEQCIRIDSQKNWEMDYTKLKIEVKNQTKKGKKIAAVICCGGTTINFAHDDTEKVYQIVTDTLKELHETYRPYFHLDSVIGWLWFCFHKQQIVNWEMIEPTIEKKIKEIVHRQDGLVHFDSCSVDFHKNGLCPYSTSFFISKSSDSFTLLNDGNYQYTSDDYQYGQFRAYRYTVENSRPATGIAAAYAAVTRLGISGFQNYLIELQKMHDLFVAEMSKYSKFTVINKYSLGWEIVFLIDFASIVAQTTHERSEITQEFINYLWQKCNQGETLPFISFTPAYKIHSGAKKQMAFLLYPMNLTSKLNVVDILDRLDQVVDEFEAAVITKSYSFHKTVLEKPIR